MAYQYLLVETRERVGLITLNRPKQLNALCDGLVAELIEALAVFEATDAISAVVLTGSDRAFAAGADIGEMVDRDLAGALTSDFLARWDRVASTRKPLIAAVAGYALGGGCELAMMCDFILAADTAKFGQPEITIGTIPGAGGSQRLTRAVGKAKAMEMCLTGRTMDAAEAERAGLVSRVVPANELVDEAVKVGNRIGALSPLAIRLAREAVNRAFETTLAEGLRHERALFYATFGLEDRSEGMRAFLDKRQANFTGR